MSFAFKIANSHALELEPIQSATRKEGMKHQIKSSAIIHLFCAMGAFIMPSIAKAATAEPPFTSILRDGNFEIRDYGVQVVAEVNVAARTGGEAAGRGFNPLAGYIFGGNQPKAKISMTAPVTRQQGTKIAMTAPVTQQSAGSDGWRVRFIMPEGSRLANMPKPNDPNVTLKEEPARRYAVLRFSGLAGDNSVARKTTELTGIMASRRLTPIGAPVLAQYDPPWTLPFRRRNEVWIEVARPR